MMPDLLPDLLDELKAVEKMVEMHMDDTSNFMLRQYQAKREQLIKDIDVLRHEAFLLTAPTFTKKQVNAVMKARKAINKWRTTVLWHNV